LANIKWSRVFMTDVIGIDHIYITVSDLEHQSSSMIG